MIDNPTRIERSQNLERRFHNNKYCTVPESGCWIWVGATNWQGYGVIRNNTRKSFAHRVSWVLHNGAIPEDLCVLHKCDIPFCVNPDHLFLGTYADNNRDRTEKGRGAIRYGNASGCAKLTERDVIEIRRLYAQGGVSQQTLGDRFGVAPRHIGMIVHRQRWAHVA